VPPFAREASLTRPQCSPPTCPTSWYVLKTPPQHACAGAENAAFFFPRHM
jgi:hypothetical protein